MVILITSLYMSAGEVILMRVQQDKPPESQVLQTKLSKLRKCDGNSEINHNKRLIRLERCLNASQTRCSLRDLRWFDRKGM